jgi:hypothetical protein
VASTPSPATTPLVTIVGGGSWLLVLAVYLGVAPTMLVALGPLALAVLVGVVGVQSARRLW